MSDMSLQARVSAIGHASTPERALALQQRFDAQSLRFSAAGDPARAASSKVVADVLEPFTHARGSGFDIRGTVPGGAYSEFAGTSIAADAAGGVAEDIGKIFPKRTSSSAENLVSLLGKRKLEFCLAGVGLLSAALIVDSWLIHVAKGDK